MSGERILVIDDTGYSRLLISRILEQENYQVEQAEGGVEAYRLLSRRRYDLVLCDLMMPDKDGLTLFEDVQAATFIDDNGTIPTPPFILITAVQQKEVLGEAIRMGFQDVILKPIVKERLLDSMRTCLDLNHNRVVALEITGNYALLLSSLGKTLGAKPEEVARTVIESLQALSLEGSITNLTSFGKKLRELLQPPPD